MRLGTSMSVEVFEALGAVVHWRFRALVLSGISLYKALAFKVQDYLRIFRVSGLKA